MPIELTPTGAYPTQFIAPADGDFVDGASVQGTAQPIINATDYVKQAIPQLSATDRYLCFPPTPLIQSGLVSGIGPFVQRYNDVGGDGPCVYPVFDTDTNAAIPFSLPVGFHTGRMKNIYIAVRSDTGQHPGGLPANMPYFNLGRDLALTGSDDPMATSYFDTSASVGAYESWHYISAEGLDLRLSPEGAPGDVYHFTLFIHNESGARGASGLAIGMIFVGLSE